jgi:HK97 family phage prohead protease
MSHPSAESAPSIRYRRFRAVDAAPADDGSLDLVLSTQDPVDCGGWTEVLVHAQGAVDTSACRTLLLNHDADQIIGRIDGISIADGKMTCRATLLPGAMCESGVSVQDAVAAKALSGVSIGYTYSHKDCAIDNESRTCVVNRWRLLEGSLTPIPADPAAGVRSFPQATKESTMTESAPAPAAPVSTDAERSAAHAASTREAALLRVAHSHGLDWTPADNAGCRSVEEGIAILLARKSQAAANQPGAIPGEAVVPTVTVTRAGEDKVRDAAVGALLASSGFRAGTVTDSEGNPYDVAANQRGNRFVGLGILDMVRQVGAAMGLDTLRYTRKDLAHLALGRPDQISRRDAANVAAGMFPSFVFLDAMNKAMSLGFAAGGRSINYQQIVSRQSVPDFRNFNIGQLGASNLAQTAEDAAFPELQYSEGVYQSKLKMWGGTISLTLQALMNDDTGSFTKQLGQAGVIAQKTINKRAFQKLLMGTSSSEATSTWTNNTTSGGSLVYATADACVAARAKLALVRTALMKKTGLDGNPLGTIATKLIVGPTREVEAAGLLGIAPGQQNSQNLSMDLVVSPWLEASTLTGNSTTSYYIMADPNEVTGLVLSTINGMEAPQVAEYDSGAVAARKWKIFLPFEVDLVYETIAGTATIAAAQQGTT